MSDNARNKLSDVRFAPVGMGMMIRWHCFGCGQSRATLGSKGAGIHKRCVQCQAAKAVRKAVAA
jgi:hypothetical protein